MCTDGNGLVEITVHRLNRGKRGKSSSFGGWGVGEGGKDHNLFFDVMKALN